MIDNQFAIIEKLKLCKSEKPVISDLKAAFSNYKNAYSPVLTKLLAENFEGTHQGASLRILSGYYDDYLAKEDQQIRFFRQHAELSSDKLTAKTNSTSALLLFVGTLPYLLLIGALVISFVIIIWLGNIFNFGGRQHE